MILIKTQHLPKINSRSGKKKKKKERKGKNLVTRSRECGRRREGGGLQL